MHASIMGDQLRSLLSRDVGAVCPELACERLIRPAEVETVMPIAASKLERGGSMLDAG
jgi:hypothetical protein